MHFCTIYFAKFVNAFEKSSRQSLQLFAYNELRQSQNIVGYTLPPHFSHSLVFTLTHLSSQSVKKKTTNYCTTVVESNRSLCESFYQTMEKHIDKVNNECYYDVRKCQKEHNIIEKLKCFGYNFVKLLHNKLPIYRKCFIDTFSYFL